MDISPCSFRYNQKKEAFPLALHLYRTDSSDVDYKEEEKILLFKFIKSFACRQ